MRFLYHLIMAVISLTLLYLLNIIFHYIELVSQVFR